MLRSYNRWDKLESSSLPCVSLSRWQNSPARQSNWISCKKEHFNLKQTESNTDFSWKYPVWISCYKRVDRVGEEGNPTLEFVSTETEAEEEARADLGTKTTRLWSAYLTESNRGTENRIGRNTGENRPETTVIGIFQAFVDACWARSFFKRKEQRNTQNIRVWEIWNGSSNNIEPNHPNLN